MSDIRPIDANALKEDFKERLSNCNDWIERAKDKETKIRASAVKSFIAEVIMTIDNAPTVETDIEVATKDAYEHGYTDGWKERFGEPDGRPKGEWIIDGHHIRCNRCNEYICNTDREGNKIPDNFCPNCGADMRKGQNDETENR